MGAWGTGVFESDTALDYLDGLANACAEVDEDGDILPGSVERTQVRRVLTETLSLGPAWDAGEAYTACGLVAAALAGVSRENLGTNLFAKMSAHMKGESAQPGEYEALGLDGHCGHLALLDTGDANSLAPLALTSVQALRADSAWLGEWNTPQSVLTHLDGLERILSIPGALET